MMSIYKSDLVVREMLSAGRRVVACIRFLDADNRYFDLARDSCSASVREQGVCPQVSAIYHEFAGRKTEHYGIVVSWPGAVSRHR